MFVTTWCLIILYFFVNFTKECANNGYPFENYLGTMTPYRTVSNKTFDKMEYEGCTPKKIWMIVRHGTRNPSAKMITKMRNRLPEIRDLILNNENRPNDYVRNRDLDLFQKWKFTLEPTDAHKLVHEGEEEMLLLAERMQGRFPTIFENVYSNTTHKFKFTDSHRTKKSAFYFVAGLFGRATAKDVYFPDPSKKDPILRFYKLCDKWNKHVKKNPEASIELKLFEKGEEMTKTVREINKRLNLGIKLAVDDVILMYQMCAYETAWNKRSKSPWCSLFTKQDLMVLQYAEDLKFYWKDGYGYELSYKQACPTFGDMISTLDSKSRFPKTTIYFTHSGTLLKFLAHLGLYKDKDTLNAENFSKMSDRKWKTNAIDSFGTNLAFVSFRCGDDEKILTMHQENIIRLPSCMDSDLCDVDKINKHYLDSIDSCNFDVFCENQ